MLKLKKSTREEKMGCLFGLIGIFVGLMYNNWSFVENVRELRAADPDAEICGLPYIAGMLGAMLIGCFAGAFVGMVISRLVMPKESSIDE